MTSRFLGSVFASVSVLFAPAAVLVTAAAASAVVTTSTNPADFTLTPESFPASGATSADLVSTSGNQTLQDAGGLAHFYTNFSGVLPGNEYALNGDENFNLLLSTPQFAFAMDFVDTAVDSTFTVDFFLGASNVGTSGFSTSSPFNTALFIGFTSDTAFDRVEVRETSASNTDEYFQFYSAIPVPEPGTGLLVAAGLVAQGAARRRR